MWRLMVYLIGAIHWAERAGAFLASLASPERALDVRQALSRWAPPARPGETLLVLASILVTGALLAESFGTSYFSLLFAVPVAVAAALTLLAVRLTRRFGFPLLHMVLFMALVGNVGLLVGASLDFGPAGLVALTGAFSKLPPLSLQTVWTKLTLAPFTYGGMLLGCNLGMWLAGRLTGDDPSVCQACTLRYATQYGPHNVGMVLGMFLAGGLMPALRMHLPAIAPALIMLALMSIGMAVGSLVGSERWPLILSAFAASPILAHGRAKAIGLIDRLRVPRRPAPDTGPAVESSRADTWAFARLWQRIIGPFGMTPSQANAAHGVAWRRWRVDLISKGRSAVHLAAMAFRCAGPLVRAVRARARHLASQLEKYTHRTR